MTASDDMVLGQKCWKAGESRGTIGFLYQPGWEQRWKCWHRNYFQGATARCPSRRRPPWRPWCWSAWASSPLTSEERIQGSGRQLLATGRHISAFHPGMGTELISNDLLFPIQAQVHNLASFHLKPFISNHLSRRTLWYDKEDVNRFGASVAAWFCTTHNGKAPGGAWGTRHRKEVFFKVH